MRMRPKHLTVRECVLALTIVLAAACAQDRTVEEPMDGAGATAAPPAESAEITALRQKFGPMRDFARAAEGGYAEAITSCWYHRVEGGQGVHYANTALIDGALSAMDPEIVMYEPQAGGGMQFLGIEYIVPFDLWTSPTPPSVLGHDLHRNEALGLWVLHVWIGRDNPSGMYADWNPNVSCANAAESEDRAPPAP